MSRALSTGWARPCSPPLLGTSAVPLTASVPDRPDPMVQRYGTDNQHALGQRQVQRIDPHKLQPRIEDLYDQRTEQGAHHHTATSKQARTPDHNGRDAVQVQRRRDIRADAAYP